MKTAPGTARRLKLLLDGIKINNAGHYRMKKRNKIDTKGLNRNLHVQKFTFVLQF